MKSDTHQGLALLGLILLGALLDGVFCPQSHLPPGTAHVPVVTETGRLATDGMLDLNRAAPHELELLPGIGPVLARAIVVDRNLHGPFPTPRSLTRVRGIGPATVERLSLYLSIGNK